MHTRPPSADPQGAPDREGAYNVRSVPIRLYLPEGPVLQDLVPPVLEDGGYLSLFVFFSGAPPFFCPCPCSRVDGWMDGRMEGQAPPAPRLPFLSSL